MNLYAESERLETLKIVESSLRNCKNVQPKLKEGSAQLSLNRNRIRALELARSLLLGQENTYTDEDLKRAMVQIASIKRKSTTGLGHAKEGSGAYTRFSRLIAAMDVVLDCMEQAGAGR